MSARGFNPWPSTRKGFFSGLLVGIIVMGLLAAIAGAVILGVRWSQGYMLPLRGRTFGPDLPERSFGFGLRGRSFGFGLRGRPFGFGAFLCCPALLFIVGGFLLLALIGKRSRWHHPHRPPWCWDREKPPAAETREPADEPDAQAGDTGAASY